MGVNWARLAGGGEMGGWLTGPSPYQGGEAIMDGTASKKGHGQLGGEVMGDWPSPSLIGPVGQPQCASQQPVILLIPVIPAFLSLGFYICRL